MVLLTAVPVSAPPSILIGVMVATGAAPDAAGKATGAARLAVGGAPASGGTAAAISALSSPPPNMLSISEQAVRLRPAVNAKAKNRPFLSPWLAGIPLIMLSAARRRCPAPMRPNIEFGAQPPATVARAVCLPV